MRGAFAWALVGSLSIGCFDLKDQDESSASNVCTVACKRRVKAGCPKSDFSSCMTECVTTPDGMSSECVSAWGKVVECMANEATYICTAEEKAELVNCKSQLVAFEPCKPLDAGTGGWGGLGATSGFGGSAGWIGDASSDGALGGAAGSGGVSGSAGTLGEAATGGVAASGGGGTGGGGPSCPIPACRAAGDACSGNTDCCSCDCLDFKCN